MTLEPSRQLIVLPISPVLELELQSHSLARFFHGQRPLCAQVDVCDELPKDQQITDLPVSRRCAHACACVCVCVICVGEYTQTHRLRSMVT